MVAILIERARTAPHSAAGFAIATAAAATLAGAWYFELVLGLEPCPLCLEQRIAYYVAVPLGLAVAWLALAPARLPLARAGLVLLALLLFANAALGAYHAGIEWGFWEGPAACAAAVTPAPVGDILSALQSSARVVPCDEAAWRFLGLSLAGYNVLIAGGLALIALAAAKSAYGSSSVSQ